MTTWCKADGAQSSRILKVNVADPPCSLKSWGAVAGIQLGYDAMVSSTPICSDFFQFRCIFLLNCLLPLSPCSRIPSSFLVPLPLPKTRPHSNSSALASSHGAMLHLDSIDQPTLTSYTHLAYRFFPALSLQAT
jgi:hypothetical protein